MRVFVGMSGGVDSSVAAKRLIDRGYEVVGVFIKVWQPDFIRCNWEQERLDAMRVAAHLGIPFLTCDAVDAYKKDVADYMVRSYKEGITPNPDVMCNEYVKFGAFYAWARAHGADKIATGHYARTDIRNGKAVLLRGIDPKKDQSYFLSRIHQDVLADVIFPIGDTPKDAIRREAAQAGIWTAHKADSQGVCFLGEIDMETFLSHYIDLSHGDVLDTDGNTIGTHKGALLYTEGQRHGFTTKSRDSSTPLYVVSRDLTKNTITVGEKPQSVIGTTVELVSVTELGTGFTGSLVAEPRYHAVPEPVTIAERNGTRATLKRTSDSGHVWVRGQSCVLYAGDECVGGGIIA